MTETVEQDQLRRLVEFARVEVISADVEPWAATIAELHRSGVLDVEQAHWVVKLYNAYDSLGSAFGVFHRWGSVGEWAAAADKRDAADYQCTQERRNLRGGKVIRHLQSFHDALAGMSIDAWIKQPIKGDHPGRDFDRLTAWVRQVWGVGRQTAFEWAEFAGKVHNLPVDADNAQLWESEGPRRSLQRLYGNPKPTAEWLDQKARVCKEMLAVEGVELAWVDFETIICDFNVMRDGRYYPGRHLAALREEIDEMPEPWRSTLDAAWRRIIPPGWVDIAPGIDKAKMPVYRNTGAMITDAQGGLS